LDFLRLLSPVEVSIIFSRAHERYVKAAMEILKHFKCKRCGRCCRICSPSLTPDEIRRLSTRLEMKPAEFIRQNVDIVLDHHGPFRMKVPCPFLKGRSRPRCVIYPFRPQLCRLYPFDFNIVALRAVDKCKLSGEIAEYIESITPHTPEEMEQILERRQLSELDRAIESLCNRLFQNLPRNEFHKAVNFMLNPSGVETKKTDKVMVINLLILEYAAENLGAERG